mmetsp:Transcript_47336/g.75274  ORF Transcript_47336/g.75274 Transcript_47336/m.75274 type:complete len:91 (+) Transcript_47336:20-292(+)
MATCMLLVVKTELAVITMLRDTTQKQIAGVLCNACDERDPEQELLFVTGRYSLQGAMTVECIATEQVLNAMILIPTPGLLSLNLKKHGQA